MADEKKFLDAGGLGHAWGKIKTWLTSWKTEQFGSGNYTSSRNVIIKDAVGSSAAWGALGTSLEIDNDGSMSTNDFQIAAQGVMGPNINLYLEKNNGMLIARTQMSLSSGKVCTNKTGGNIQCLVFGSYHQSEGNDVTFSFSERLGNDQTLKLDANKTGTSIMAGSVVVFVVWSRVTT